MRHACAQISVVLMLLLTAPAYAEPDTFDLGTGTTNFRAENSDVIVNSYARVTAPLAPGDTQISIANIRRGTERATDAAAFQANDLVMVLQTTGIVPLVQDGVGPSIDISVSNVGRWEFARLSSASTATLTLSAPLIHSYAANVTQVVRVPEYNDFTVNNNRMAKAEPWDGNSGGVVALLAKGTVTVHGKISAAGAGFRAGQYQQDPPQDGGTPNCAGVSGNAPSYARKGEGIDSTRYMTASGGGGRGNVADGAGGGNCELSGGGGGGGAGRGGDGTNPSGVAERAGMGGASLSYPVLERLTFGGGGGSGHGRGNGSTQSSGGSGGGIVFIRAETISIQDADGISAAGTAGLAGGADAGGGGGAGGTVLLRFRNTLGCGTTTSIPISVKGGNGGTSTAGGLGGSGGGGRIIYQTNVLGGTCNMADSMVAGGTTTGSAASNGRAGSLIRVLGPFPSLTAPTVAPPSPTSQTRPTITGSAMASKQVVIYVNGVEMGRTYATSGGSFSFQLMQHLADGSYDVQAAVADQGVQSPKSTPVTLVVDTTAPAAPFMETLGELPGMVASQGMLLGTVDLDGDNTLLVRGTAELGSTIVLRQLNASGAEVRRGTGVANETPGNGRGWWSIRLPQAPNQPETAFTLEAKAKDAVLNESAAASLRFSLDTQAPAAPVLMRVGGRNVGADPVLINTSWPLLEGTAEATNELRVVLRWVGAGGASMQLDLEATASTPGGTWSVVPPVALGEFEYTVELSAQDRAGNAALGTTRRFIVDVSAPVRPVVDAVGGRARPPSQGMLLGTNDLTTLPSGRSLTFTGSADLAKSVTVRQLDSSGNQISTQSVPVEADGDWNAALSQSANEEAVYTLELTAWDEAENASEAATLSYRMDTLAPAPPTVETVEGTEPSADCLVSSDLPLVTNRQPFIQGAAEPQGLIEVTLSASSGQYLQPTTLVNGLPAGQGTWSLVVTHPETGLPDSSAYSLTVTVTDQAGNQSPAATYCFQLDTTAPGIPTFTTLGAAGAVNGMRVGLAGLVNGELAIGGQAEGGSTVTLWLIPVDPAQPTRETSHLVTSAGGWSGGWAELPSGSYAVEARARDRAGNVSEPRTLFFELDIIRPTVEIFPHPPRLTNSLDYVFGFRPPPSSEPLSGYECQIGTAQRAACENPYIGSVEPGIHTIKVWGVDLAGNKTEDSQPATYTWEVDSDSPLTIFLIDDLDPLPNDGDAVNEDEIEFVIRGNKPGLDIHCELDGVSEEPCNCTESRTDEMNRPICVKHITGLGDGQHTFVARAESLDPPGETPPEFWSTLGWIVDTRKPDTVVIERPGDWVAVDHVTLVFGALSEPRTPRFFCEISRQGGSGPERSECSSPATFPGLEDGSYTLTIKAVDAAGNQEEVPAEARWIVDTASPAAPMLSSPVEGGHYRVVNVEGLAAGEPFSTIAVYLDDAQEPVASVRSGSAGEWNLVLADEQLPADGIHLLRAVTRDRAGNVGEPSPPVTFVVDTTPPAVEIVEGPADRANATVAKFTFALAEGEEATLSCSLDAGEFTACNKEVTYSELEEGPHALYVRATDTAGNVGPAAIHNWRIFLAGEAHLQGGGVGCAATGAGQPLLWLLSMIGLVLVARRR